MGEGGVETCRNRFNTVRQTWNKRHTCSNIDKPTFRVQQEIVHSLGACNTANLTVSL